MEKITLVVSESEMEIIRRGVAKMVTAYAHKLCNAEIGTEEFEKQHDRLETACGFMNRTNGWNESEAKEPTEEATEETPEA